MSDQKRRGDGKSKTSKRFTGRETRQAEKGRRMKDKQGMTRKMMTSQAEIILPPPSSVVVRSQMKRRWRRRFLYSPLATPSQDQEKERGRETDREQTGWHQQFCGFPLLFLQLGRRKEREREKILVVTIIPVHLSIRLVEYHILLLPLPALLFISVRFLVSLSPGSLFLRVSFHTYTSLIYMYKYIPFPGMQ